MNKKVRKAEHGIYLVIYIFKLVQIYKYKKLHMHKIIN